MSELIKQHLIDPEICIRCYTCEEACPIDAITHDDNNVVVDAEKCNFCMDCIAPCPTGSIDNWRVVDNALFARGAVSAGMELPAQAEFAEPETDHAGHPASSKRSTTRSNALLAEAHKGAGGRSEGAGLRFEADRQSLQSRQAGRWRRSRATTASTPKVADADVRHIILDLGMAAFPVLEGQSVGIIPPGKDGNGKPHLPRLYSISSPRDGERPNTNNLVADGQARRARRLLKLHLRPEDAATRSAHRTVRRDLPDATTIPTRKLIMICTGTGSAPFRAFTMRRQRTAPKADGHLHLYFGARTPGELPYFGPLKRVPESLLSQRLVFSRVPDQPKRYVQDQLRDDREILTPLITAPKTHVYVCGLKGMEDRRRGRVGRHRGGGRR